VVNNTMKSRGYEIVVDISEKLWDNATMNQTNDSMSYNDIVL